MLKAEASDCRKNKEVFSEMELASSRSGALKEKSKDERLNGGRKVKEELCLC